MTVRFRVECLNPECGWVGYRSPHPLNECACYADYAYYCRPDTPGPGCPNGANLRARCPRCHSDWTPDHRDLFRSDYLYARQVWTRAYAARMAAGRAQVARTT
jgi:hypothetical protein